MPKPVIFLAFSNDITRPLDNLQAEQIAVEKMLRPALEANLCDLIIESSATTQEIISIFQQAEYKDRIAVFHFAGHASGFALSVEAANGEPDVAHAGGFAAFLGQQKGLQLVFLNACSTQAQVEHLLNADVAAVIATSRAINDQIAADFSGFFYQSMGAGNGVMKSFKTAEAAVRMRKGDSPTRSIYWQGMEEDMEEISRFPWDFYVRAGAEIVEEWSLPDAAGNPLFGMPPLPDIQLPPKPFRYLQWFRREDAEIFFGRSYQIRSLYDKVKDQKGAAVVHLYGASGVGKSSLLAAGLMPRLELEYETRYIRRNPRLGLTESLKEGLLNGETSSQDIHQLWYEIEGNATRPLIVVMDQVEEVFTRPNQDLKDELADFFRLIRAIFQEQENAPQGKIILSYRKEYLAEIEDSSRKLRLDYAKVFLQKLQRNDIMDAVIGLTLNPKTQLEYGLQVEEGLAAVIADDLLEDSESSIAPVLQILLSNMWEMSCRITPEAPAFSLKLYQHLKKKGIWLEDFLDQQIESLERWNPEAVYSGLVLDVLALHVSDRGTATSRAVTDILEAYPHQQETLAELLKECQKCYLLIRTGTGEKERSRLAHDTLAPLILLSYNRSNAPAQQAERILKSRLKMNRESNRMRHLDATDLRMVNQGKMGMQRWGEDALQLVLCSHAIIEASEHPTRSFRLAERAYQLADNQLSRQALVQAYHAGLFFQQWFSYAPSVAWAKYSPDSDCVLLVMKNGSASLYTPNGTLIRHLESSESLLYGCFSQDGERLAVVDALDRIIIFSDEGQPIMTLTDERPTMLRDRFDAKMQAMGIKDSNVLDICFSEDGNHLRVLSREAAYVHFSLATGSAIQLAEGGLEDSALSSLGRGALRAASFSKNGYQAALYLADGRVVMRDFRANTELPLGELENEPSFVHLCDDNHSVLVGVENRLIIWNSYKTEEEGNRIEQSFSSNITDAQMSADGRLIVATFSNQKGWILSAEGEKVFQLAGYEGSVDALSIGPQGKYIFMVAGGQVYRWMLHANSLDALQIVDTAVQQAHFSPDQEHLLITYGDTARLIHLPTHQHTQLRGHKASIYSAYFSPDGKRLITAGADADIREWDIQGNKSLLIQGELKHNLIERLQESFFKWQNEGMPPAKAVERGKGMIQEIQGHKGGVLGLSYSPDGKWIVSASEDESIKLWNRKGQLVRMLAKVKGEEEVQELIDAAREKLESNVSAIGQVADIFSVWEERVEEERKGHASSVMDVHFAPDSEHILSVGADGSWKLWHINGELVQSVQASRDGLRCGAISDDGKWVVVGNVEGEWSLWDREGHRRIAVHAHESAIHSIRFSADASQILTASADDTAAIWTREGELVLRLSAHTDDLYCASFSPDGRFIVTASADRTARIWLTNPQAILQSTQYFPIWQLSEEEWAEYGA